MLLCSILTPPEDICRWEAMLDALDAVSPLLEAERVGRIYLDMRGIAGAPTQWCARVRAVLAPFGSAVRCGLSEDAFCAAAAARYVDGYVVAPGEEAAFLAPLPLTYLECEARIIERFALLGIERLGQLAALPHGPLLRRFGAQAALWHQRARGQERRPLLPRTVTLPIEAGAFGEGEAATQEQLLFSLRVLLARIADSCARSGRSAGALWICFLCDDGSERELELSFALPTADERAMFEVLRARLERERFEAAVIGLRVRALRLEEGGSSQALFVRERVQRQDLAIALARLEGLLGEPVLRAELRPAHNFERRFALERFSLDSVRACERDAPALPAEMIAPLHLLAGREVAVELRDGIPVSLGKPPRRIYERAGPWRIEEYARGLPTRDEYDIALDDGQWYRIAHEGVRWYLCGAYE